MRLVLTKVDKTLQYAYLKLFHVGDWVCTPIGGQEIVIESKAALNNVNQFIQVRRIGRGIKNRAL